MLRTLAKVFGVVFLLIGVLGFIPAVAPLNSEGHRHLLGLFDVDTVHNIVHLLSGAAALATGLSSAKAARLYFLIFGSVYGLVTLVGLIQQDSVLGLFSINGADNILHLVLTVAILGIGLFVKDDVGGSANAEA